MEQELVMLRESLAERAVDPVVRSQYESFLGLGQLPEIFDAVPDIMLVLNAERQIVFANTALLEHIGVCDRESICGLRFGEVLGCSNEGADHKGCGHSQACGACGQFRAIHLAEQGEANTQVCLMTLNQARGAIDFRVWVRPLQVENQKFLVATLKDISDQNRRAALEQTFFHDVLGTVGVLRGFAEILQEGCEETIASLNLGDRISRLAGKLIEEIESHKILTEAENDRLRVRLAPLDIQAFFEEIVGFYREQKSSSNLRISTEFPAETVLMITDETLLRRVFSNMLKNAVEASSSGDVIQVGFQSDQQNIEFWVQNAASIPKEHQSYLFKRSYSTKGEGRGLGTYSMRFLSERYLQGSVHFTSSPEDGTRFIARYPLTLDGTV